MKLPQLDFFMNLIQGRKSPPEPIRPDIDIHYLPRLRKGWRAEWHPLGRLKLTLPGYMESPEFHAVRKEILHWCTIARKRKTATIKAESRVLERKIWEQCEAILASLGKNLTTRGDRIPPIRTKGRVHDLHPHFEIVNQRYFEGKLECRITWSGRVGGLSYHSQRKDRETGNTIHLVSISRGYDFENCPDWALQGIIYHECLHIAVPPEQQGSRRVVHGRAFRLREKQFHAFAAWKEWHAKVLPGNVRRLRKGKSHQ